MDYRLGIERIIRAAWVALVLEVLCVLDIQALPVDYDYWASEMLSSRAIDDFAFHVQHVYDFLRWSDLADACALAAENIPLHDMTTRDHCLRIVEIIGYYRVIMLHKKYSNIFTKIAFPMLWRHSIFKECKQIADDEFEQLVAQEKQHIWSDTIKKLAKACIEYFVSITPACLEQPLRLQNFLHARMNRWLKTIDQKTDFELEMTRVFVGISDLRQKQQLTLSDFNRLVDKDNWQGPSIVYQTFALYFAVFFNAYYVDRILKSCPSEWRPRIRIEQDYVGRLLQLYPDYFRKILEAEERAIGDCLVLLARS